MYMKFVTTTDLRTKSSNLVDSLKRGESVSLIHRSKIVGVIKPAKEEPKKFDAKRFARLVTALNLPLTTYAEREKRYREHLMKKYGKGISGR